MTTVAALIERLRTEILDDAIAAIEEDYAFQTVDIVAALNSVHRDLAERLKLIEDSTTAAVCNITVALVGGAYPRSYALDSRVLEVLRLKFPGVTRPLVSTSVAVLDLEDPGWDEKEGTPTAFVVGRDRRITFNRQPIAGGTVAMTVYRKPLSLFKLDSIENDTPEFDYDDAMIHGAAAILYGKDDQKSYDPARADKWSKVYERFDIPLIVRALPAFAPDVPICRPDRW